MSCQFCSSPWLVLTRQNMSKVFEYGGKAPIHFKMSKDIILDKQLPGKILHGWEKKRTENGIPYYLSHSTQCSQWDHPILRRVMEELRDFQIVKYSTYRLALKLRSIQNVFKLNLVSTETLIKIFNQIRTKPVISEMTMTCTELEYFLNDVFNIARAEQPALTDPRLSAELFLNFVVSLYDSTRGGVVHLLSIFVALIIFSEGKLHEKYKFLFRLLANHNNCMTRNSLMFLLNIIAEIPELLNEKSTFGKSFVPAAVENCFSINPGPLGITEEMFLSWLLQEPQTVVWVSTFFRLVTAETVSHNTKCSVCKMDPIVGLRYRCLYCFSYDLCQHCFFTGQTNKSHKLLHPIQEYCTVATSKEDRRVMMKRLSNKFKMKKNKQSYLPILPTQTIPEVDVLENHHADVEPTPTFVRKGIPNGEEFMNCTILNGMPMNTLLSSQQSELESVIIHLEQQQKLLQTELVMEQMHDMSMNSSGSDDGKSTMSFNSTISRQEILLDHEKQLELQLRRLRRILKSLRKMNKKAEDSGLEMQKEDDETDCSDTNLQTHLNTISTPFVSTSTPTYIAAEVHPPPKDENGSSMLSPISYSHQTSEVANGGNEKAVSDSTRELNAIQEELENIMKHLQMNCSAIQIKSEPKNENGDLVKAAVDVNDILANLVDKVRVDNPCVDRMK